MSKNPDTNTTSTAAVITPTESSSSREPVLRARRLVTTVMQKEGAGAVINGHTTYRLVLTGDPNTKKARVEMMVHPLGVYVVGLDDWAGIGEEYLIPWSNIATVKFEKE